MFEPEKYAPYHWGIDNCTFINEKKEVDAIEICML